MTSSPPPSPSHPLQESHPDDPTTRTDTPAGSITTDTDQPIPDVKFDGITIATGEEALKLCRALETSREEAAKVVQAIIDTEGCDPERAWLLRVFLAVMESSGEPVALQEGNGGDAV